MMRIAGALLLLGSWSVLLWGLYLLPVAEDPLLDLDGGPAFALNLEVYLPALALTAMLLVAAPAVLAQRVGSVVGIGTGVAIDVFAAWVATHQELLDYVPGLPVALWWTVGLSMAAVLVLLGEGAPRDVSAPVS